MRSGLAVDVENEFATLLREASLLADALPELQKDEVGEGRRWIEISGVAAAVEKIYSGCERIMHLLAKRVDGAGIETSDGWHATLLKRLANPFPGVRDAILSSSCVADLDRFRSFRHRVRNSYGIALDAEIVLERARELGPTLTRFHEEVTTFLRAWEGDPNA